jgi:hypothetical protein
MGFTTSSLPDFMPTFWDNLTDPYFFLLAKLEKCIPSHLLSLWGEDEGEGDIFRLHPHSNPLPPAGEGE